MKKGFEMFFLTCLLLVAGCGTMSGTPEAGQAVAESSSSSAQWEYFPAFKTLGMQLTSDPPQHLKGPVEVSLTTEQDVEIAADIRDADSGKEIEDFPVTSQNEGKTWRLVVDFPQSGRYMFTIFGKLRSTAGRTFAAVMRTIFTVAIGPGSHWKELPAFKALGFSAIALPPADIADEARIVLSTDERIDLGWIVKNTTTGAFIDGAVDLTTSGKESTVTLSFPEAGAYELRLAGKPTAAGDDAWETIAVARFTATVRASASGVPPNWKVWPAFRKYGIAIVSSTKRETADEATLVLTASQEIKLAYSLANRTTGKDINSMPRSVEIDKVGQEHRVTVFFPESGEYELGLFAQADGEEGYSSLARVSFSAQVVPGPVLPANWEVFPRFRKFGIGVVESPARDVGDELEIVLSVPEGWESSVDLREKGLSDPVRTIVSEIAGKEQRITAVLPKSGDYELGLSGKVGSGRYEQSIARVSFKATVDEERSPYRLWRIGGRWPRLPVKQVQSFKEQWRPFGEYPVYNQYRKGILTEEITISASQSLFALAKGTAVTFSSMYGSEFLVDVVVANLAKDATVAISGSSVLFKAGSPITLAADRLVGQLFKDAKIAIDGNALFAPKSSRLLFRNDRLSEAELTGRPTFTVGSRVYECAGSVLVEEYGEAGSPVRVRIMTAKEYALKVGTTSFTLPPGSLITFVRQKVDRVVFVKDSRVTIAGAVETIPAGWGFQFDDQGGGRKFKAE